MDPWYSSAHQQYGRFSPLNNFKKKLNINAIAKYDLEEEKRIVEAIVFYRKTLRAIKH
jgi:hypothetical protein